MIKQMTIKKWKEIYSDVMVVFAYVTGILIGIIISHTYR